MIEAGAGYVRDPVLRPGIELPGRDTGIPRVRGIGACPDDADDLAGRDPARARDWSSLDVFLCGCPAGREGHGPEAARAFMPKVVPSMNRDAASDMIVPSDGSTLIANANSAR